MNNRPSFKEIKSTVSGNRVKDYRKRNYNDDNPSFEELKRTVSYNERARREQEAQLPAARYATQPTSSTLTNPVETTPVAGRTSKSGGTHGGRGGTFADRKTETTPLPSTKPTSPKLPPSETDIRKQMATGGNSAKYAVENEKTAKIEQERQRREQSKPTIEKLRDKKKEYEEFIADEKNANNSEKKAQLITEINALDRQNKLEMTPTDVIKARQQQLESDRQNGRLTKKEYEAENSVYANELARRYYNHFTQLSDTDRDLLRSYTGSRDYVGIDDNDAINKLSKKYGVSTGEVINWADYQKRADNQEEREAEAKAISNFAEEHPIAFGAFGGPVARGGMSVMSALTTPMRLAERYRNKKDIEATGAAYLGNDVNSDLNVFNTTSEAYEKQYNAGTGDVAKNIDSLIVSSIETLAAGHIGSAVGQGASAALGGLAKTAEGAEKAGKIASKIGSAVGGSVIGVSAADQAYQDMIQQGIPDDKAKLVAVAAGVNEMLWETLSISQLQAFQEFDTADLLKNRMYKQLIKEIGKNVGKGIVTNFSEEFMTELGNVVAESLILGEASDYQQAKQGYQSTGFNENEARRAAMSDIFEDRILPAGFWGGVMGLGFGVAGTVSGAPNQASVADVARQAYTDRALSNYAGKLITKSGRIGDVIADAKAVGGRAQEYAERLIGKRGGEENLKPQDVGRISLETNLQGAQDESSAQILEQQKKAREEQTRADLERTLEASGGIKDDGVREAFFAGYSGGDMETYTRNFKAATTLASAGLAKNETELAELLYDSDNLEGLSRAALKLAMDSGINRTWGEVGLHDFSATSSIKKKSQRKVVENQLKIIDSFAKKYGLSIIAVESMASNGLHPHGTNQIILAMDADGGLLTRTVGHEAYHYLETADEQNSTTYAKDLKDFVLDYYYNTKGKAWVDNYLAETYNAKDKDGNLVYKTDEAKQREFIADHMFDALTSERAVQELAEGNPTLFEQIKNHISEIISYIREQINRLANKGDFAEIATMQNDLDMLTEINNRFFDAMNASIGQETAREQVSLDDILQKQKAAQIAQLGERLNQVRDTKAEAERLAQEEAERAEAERRAQEEAERKAQEEAERQAQDSADYADMTDEQEHTNRFIRGIINSDAYKNRYGRRDESGKFGSERYNDFIKEYHDDYLNRDWFFAESFADGQLVADNGDKSLLESAKKRLKYAIAGCRNITELNALEAINKDFTKWSLNQAANEKSWGRYGEIKDAASKVQGYFTRAKNAMAKEAAAAGETVGKDRSLRGIYDTKKIQTLFNEYNSDKELATLANKVFNICDKLGIRYKGDSNYGDRTGGVSSGLRVRYNNKYFGDTSVGDQQKAEVLLHEAIHAVTSYYLDGTIVKNSNGEYALEYKNKYGQTISTHQITKEIADSVQALNDIYKDVTKYAKQPNTDINMWGTGNGDYGTKNVNEFAAELSNTFFREKLKKAGFWQRIKNAIKGLLGINAKDPYDAASKALDKLLDNYDKSIANKYDMYRPNTKTWSFSTKRDTDYESFINHSMTMERAKEMIQRTFLANNIKSFYDGDYANGDEWLAGEGADEVAMYADNTEAIILKYLNPLYEENDDFNVDDLIGAYVNGTLVGKEQPKAKRIDITKSGTIGSGKFYEPREISDVVSAMETAKQKVTKSNAADVYKARAKIVMFAHSENAAEQLGMTKAELNSTLRKWSGLPAKALELSKSINSGVPLENRWTGIENLSLVNRQTITADEIKREVKGISGNADEREIGYIGRAMLGLDTHINWSNLLFEFREGREVSKNVLGLYSGGKEPKIIVTSAPNTVAHEMGHALDDIWGREITGNKRVEISSFHMNEESVLPEARQWANNFYLFLEDVSDSARSSDNYYQNKNEVFARFVAKFVAWTEKNATGNDFWFNTGHHGDNFTTKLYMEFARLLQEKSALNLPAVESERKYSTKRDTEYMDAVKSGNEAEQQRLVDEAAKEAGYTIKAWHGTNAKFTQFSKKLFGRNYGSWSELGGGFYFAPSEKGAERWADAAVSKKGGSATIMPVFLSAKNMIGYNESLRNNQIAKDIVFGDKGLDQPEEYGDTDKNYWRNWILDRTTRFIEYLQNRHYSPEQISDLFIAMGYDGISDATGENGQYVVFNPEQIKSADPITYDDNGNVIPLSERFNPNSNDIRQSTRRDLESSYLESATPEELAEIDAEVDRRMAEQDEQVISLNTQIAELTAQRDELMQNEKANRDEITKLNNRIGILTDKLEARRKQVQSLKGKLQRRDAKLAENKQTVDDARKAIRRGVVQEKAQEKRKETAERNYQIGQIRKVADKLQKNLLENSDKHKVIEPLKDSVSKFVKLLVDLDTFDSKKTLSLANALHKMNEVLSNNKGEDAEHYEITTFFDEAMAEKITNLSNKLSEYSEQAHDEAIRKDYKYGVIHQLTPAELKDIKEIARYVNHIVTQSNKAFSQGIKQNITELGESSYNEVAGSKQRKIFSHGVQTAMMKPVTFFDMMGSKTLENLYANVRDGENKWARVVDNARKYRIETQQKHNYDSWKDDKIAVKLSGETVEMSIEDALSLYATIRRSNEQGVKHLMQGGFTLDSDINLTLKDKIKGVSLTDKSLKAKAKGYLDAITAQLNANKHRITADEMTEFMNSLSAEQKAYADDMVRYMSEDMSELGNEVSLRMYGIRKFLEDYYFPIVSDPNSIYNNLAPNGTSDNRIKQMSMTKDLTPKANNPVILTGFTDTVMRHCSDMGLYYGLALPVEDFTRVYNYKGRMPSADDESGAIQENLRDAISETFSDNANKYIQQLLQDINGRGGRDAGEQLTAKFVSMFKKNAVFASMSVAIQQPSAIARTLRYIDPKYLAQTTLTKRDYDELKQWAPVAIVKEMGYFDTGVGRNAVDWMNSTEYKGAKEKAKALVTDRDFRDNALSWLPSKMDEVTWAHIWNAVKAEIADTTDLEKGSEEFYKAAADRFTYIIDRTQVYDSVFSRSQWMRSKGVAAQMATAFMAEPTTALNMLYNGAFGKLEQGETRKAAVGKSVTAFICAVALNNALKAIVSSARHAGKDDDEDKTLLEIYLNDMVSGTLDDLNLFNYIPYLKDAWSIVVKGYDATRMDTEAFSLLADAVKKWEQNGMTGDTIKAIANAVGIFTGVPVANVSKDINGVTNIFKRMLNALRGEAPKLEAENVWNAVKDGATIKQNKNRQYSKLLDSYTSGKSSKADSIESKLRYDSKSGNLSQEYLRNTIQKKLKSGKMSRAEAISAMEKYYGYKEGKGVNQTVNAKATKAVDEWLNEDDE